MDRTPTHALVRAIPGSYADFHHRRGIEISLPSMRSQHAAYLAALEAAGLHVRCVDADENLPDCVFIEDTAIVWDRQALIGRIAQHREGEQDAVAEALGRWHDVVRVPDDATLEGGDVLHTEGTTYVGLSGRTNQAGVDCVTAFLAPFGRRVVPVAVHGCLHLKTAATYLGGGTLLAAPGLIDLDAIEADEVLLTADGEAKAANSLRIGSELLILGRYPQTRGRLEAFAQRSGLHVRALDVSEFEKGDGSLTCLSLVW